MRNVAEYQLGLHARAREILLATARRAVSCAVRGEQLDEPDAAANAPELAEPRAAFVTLTLAGALRGCCGTLEARRPLVAAVWRSAWAAASSDHRFSPVRSEELPRLHYEIAVLSALRPLEVRDEDALIAELEVLRPGVLLRFGKRTATYLPKVWDGLNDPRAFLAGLKQKAGLDAEFWSTDIDWFTYDVESFSDTGIRPARVGYDQRR